jgi:hypothetical protein
VRRAPLFLVQELLFSSLPPTEHFASIYFSRARQGEAVLACARAAVMEGLMQELEVTWGRVRSVWWLIIWRAAVGGAVLGAVIGAILGFIEGMMGVSPATITLSSAVAGGLVNLAWSLFVVRWALTKKYRAFRLAMVPSAP